MTLEAWYSRVAPGGGGGEGTCLIWQTRIQSSEHQTRDGKWSIIVVKKKKTKQKQNITKPVLTFRVLGGRDNHYYTTETK